MDHGHNDAEARIAEVLAAAAFALVAGLLLWPPGAVYWTAVVNVLGENATLAVVAVLATALGAWFARTAAFALVHLLAGGLLAYGTGMLAIEFWLRPDSPVHLLWYGVLLTCALVGAAGWTALERFVRTRRAN